MKSDWSSVVDKIFRVSLSELKPYENNPRMMGSGYKKVANSIKRYGFLVPFVVNNIDDRLIVCGHTRYEAAKYLCKKYGKNESEIKVPCVSAQHLTESEIKQFRIADNKVAEFSQWDYEKLDEEFKSICDFNEWEEFGFFDDKKETEKLSGIEDKFAYYEPKNVGQIDLNDCINLDKFNAKVDAINSMDLTDMQKETLKLFAYRFIRIDFEAVANYYAFFATEEEKKAIERLRLVVVDGGLNGFIKDELFKLRENMRPKK